jgi:TrmH family RNA methyltransferase
VVEEVAQQPSRNPSTPAETPLLTAGNARVKQARKLSRRSERSERRLFLAEGWKALAEAKAVPGCVVEVFATAAAAAEHAALLDGLAVHLVEDRAAASLSGAVTPSGIVGVCRFVDRPLGVVLQGRTVVVCADVRDPGNAGTIIRTADAAGASGVVLAGHSVDPYNDKAVRASVGSLFHVPIAVAGDAAAAVEAAREAGYVVLAADGAGEVDLFAADGLMDGKVAWLFGNEAWGLPQELAALADHRVAIPILGRAESLNLATAAAVCLYATARARTQA